MSVTEVIPLLVVGLLLLSASGVEPDRIDVVVDGDHVVTDVDDALAVGGGTVTVPGDATLDGHLLVVGGNVTLAGQVTGDVRLVAGSLTVADGATITGELQALSGNLSVAPGAAVARRSTIELTDTAPSPWRSVGFLAMQALVVALAGAWLTRRAPGLLENVGDAVTEHAVVSGTVGAIAGLSLLVLFVYMAFTLVLLPLSIVGLLAEVGVVAYAYLVYGYLVGRRLPVDRPALATALGSVAFLLGVELLGHLPLVGTLVQLGLVVVGFGAVLVTYFGLQEFEPAVIPG
ncbi:polymer-forming cytoskeletal protein [Halobacteriales archaeon Cl-PHB]